MLAVMSAAPLAAPQSQSDFCQDKSLRSVSINSELTLQTQYSNQIRILSNTTVTVPSTWRGAGLLLNDNGSQWTAMSCFLPVAQYVYRAVPPSVTETNSTVVIHDLATTTVNPGEVYYTQSNNWSAGLWTISKSQALLNVSFQGFSLPIPVKWTLELQTDDLAVTQPRPPPTTESRNGELTWNFTSAPSQKVNETAAVVLPQRLRWEWGAWAWPTGVLTDIVNILGYGLAFYLIVYYLCGRFSRRSGVHETRKTAQAARRLALFGGGWYVLGGANDYLIRLIDHGIAQQRTAAVIQAYVAVTSAAAFYFTARPKSRYNRASAGVILLAALFAPAPLLREPIDFPVDLLPLILAMFLFYAGVALWGWRIWTTLRQSVSPAAAELSSRSLWLAYSVALVLTVVDIIDPVLTSSRDWSHWSLTNAATSRLDWIARSTAYNGESAWIDGDLQAALWLLVAVAFIAVLRMAARDHPDVFFQGRGRLKLWSMAILLGFGFEGVWGYFAGIPLPVGLLLLVLGFRYVAVSGKGTPAVASKLRLSHGTARGGRLLTLHKEAFYDAAERIAELNGQLTSMSNDGLTVAASQVRRTQLRAEIEELETSHPAVGSPASWSRPHIRQVPAAVHSSAASV